MDSNKYNEAIKRKLESIEPKFEENDWDEMKSFMTLNAPKSTVFGRTFLYSAGIILLLSSLFFNFKQNNEIQSLIEKNNTLILKNEVKPITETKIIQQKDTIYLTKYITKWKTVERIVYVNSNLENTDNQWVNLKKQGLKNISNDIIQNLENEQKVENLTFNQEKKQLSESKNDLKNDEDKILNINTLNRISSIQNPFVWSKKLPKVNFKSNLLIPDKRKQIIIKLPSFDNLKYRVGLDFYTVNDQTGGGILSEVLLNKNWSINSELRFMNIAGRSYYTAEQYQFDTKQDFKQQYAPYVPANFDLINIDFQHYLLQMPIGITYRYPLRHDFTVLFSTTTDLDLYVKQYINFDYKQDNSTFIEATHKSILSKSILNNIEFSAGLEKKYRRMIFQVNPFISTQLKEVVYKKDNFVFGAKVRVLVNSRK